MLLEVRKPCLCISGKSNSIAYDAIILILIIRYLDKEKVMKSYLASQLIGTIWIIGGVLGAIEGGNWNGCFGIMVIGAAYYVYSLYLWGTKQ